MTDFIVPLSSIGKLSKSKTQNNMQTSMTHMNDIQKIQAENELDLTDK